MLYLGLLLSGAALLINGLGLLGRIPLRDSAMFSMLIGGVQLALGIAFVATNSDAEPQTLLSAAGMFLFALTYVYVGLNTVLQLGSQGLGWFSGLAGALGLLLATAWFNTDPLLSVLWLAWAVLWALFFVQMVLGRVNLIPFIGWSLVLLSQTTATAPALLGLSGNWPDSQATAATAAAVLTTLFLLAARLGRRKRRPGHPAPRLPARTA